MKTSTSLAISFDEAARYWRNARDLLARCSKDGDFYRDMKPVREAFGTAWLAIDTAIKAALLGKGLTRKQVPRSWEPLLAAAGRHLAVRNGRLVRMLNDAHHLVHLAGYYYADINHRRVAEAAMDAARDVVEKLSGHKIG